MQSSTNKGKNTKLHFFFSYYIRAFTSAHVKISINFSIITYFLKKKKLYTHNYLFYTTFHHNTTSLSIFYYYLKTSFSSSKKNYCPQSK